MSQYSLFDHDHNLMARSSLWRTVYESKQHLSYSETYKIDEISNQYARQLLEYTEHRDPHTRNGRRKTCVSYEQTICIIKLFILNFVAY